MGVVLFMNRVYIKTISVILSLAMVLTSADYGYSSTLFKTTSHAQRHLIANTPQEKITIIDDPSIISIPQKLGTIVEYHKGSQDSIIIHIQDRHIDPTAQLNISDLIDEFIQKHKVSLMMLEGASTELDTSFYDSYEDNEIKKKVSKAFLDHAIFTGAEYYKITNKDKYLRAIGAEDKSLYLKHLDTYKSTLIDQKSVLNFLQAVNSNLSTLKNTLYTKAQKQIDNSANIYSKGAIKLPEYVKTLSDNAKKAKLDISKHKDLVKFIALVEKEAQIDFKKAESQREEVIKQVSDSLDRVELNELLRKSMDFRTAKISQEEFYDYLFNIIETQNLNKKDYNHLSQYREYINLSKDINHLKVFDEADDLGYELMLSLSNTPITKDLVLYARSARLLYELYSLKLTPRQLNYLDKHKDHADISNIKRFLISLSNKYSLHIPSVITGFNINSHLIEYSKDYYSLALERDTALIDNTLNTMRRLRTDKAILVAGGFHTQGITNILKQKGLSYIVICPNICHGDYDQLYNDRMAGILPSIEELEPALLDALVMPLNTDGAGGVSPKAASSGAQKLFEKLLTPPDKVSLVNIDAWLKANPDKAADYKEYLIKKISEYQHLVAELKLLVPGIEGINDLLNVKIYDDLIKENPGLFLYSEARDQVSELRGAVVLIKTILSEEHPEKYDSSSALTSQLFQAIYAHPIVSKNRTRIFAQWRNARNIAGPGMLDEGLVAMRVRHALAGPQTVTDSTNEFNVILDKILDMSSNPCHREISSYVNGHRSGIILEVDAYVRRSFSEDVGAWLNPFTGLLQAGGSVAAESEIEPVEYQIKKHIPSLHNESDEHFARFALSTANPMLVVENQAIADILRQGLNNLGIDIQVILQEPVKAEKESSKSSAAGFDKLMQETLKNLVEHGYDEVEAREIIGRATDSAEKIAKILRGEKTPIAVKVLLENLEVVAVLLGAKPLSDFTLAIRKEEIDIVELEKILQYINPYIWLRMKSNKIFQVDLIGGNLDLPSLMDEETLSRLSPDQIKGKPRIVWGDDGSTGRIIDKKTALSVATANKEALNESEKRLNGPILGKNIDILDYIENIDSNNKLAIGIMYGYPPKACKLFADNEHEKLDFVRIGSEYAGGGIVFGGIVTATDENFDSHADTMKKVVLYEAVKSIYDYARASYKPASAGARETAKASSAGFNELMQEINEVNLNAPDAKQQLVDILNKANAAYEIKAINADELERITEAINQNISVDELLLEIENIQNKPIKFIEELGEKIELINQIIISMGSLGRLPANHQKIIPKLMEFMRSEKFTDAAKKALFKIGPDIMPVIVDELKDPKASRAVKEACVEILDSKELNMDVASLNEIKYTLYSKNIRYGIMDEKAYEFFMSHPDRIAGIIPYIILMLYIDISLDAEDPFFNAYPHPSYVGQPRPDRLDMQYPIAVNPKHALEVLFKYISLPGTIEHLGTERIGREGLPKESNLAFWVDGGGLASKLSFTDEGVSEKTLTEYLMIFLHKASMEMVKTSPSHVRIVKHYTRDDVIGLAKKIGYTLLLELKEEGHIVLVEPDSVLPHQRDKYLKDRDEYVFSALRLLGEPGKSVRDKLDIIQKIAGEMHLLNQEQQRLMAPYLLEYATAEQIHGIVMRLRGARARGAVVRPGPRIIDTLSSKANLAVEMDPDNLAAVIMDADGIPHVVSPLTQYKVTFELVIYHTQHKDGDYVSEYNYIPSVSQDTRSFSDRKNRFRVKISESMDDSNGFISLQDDVPRDTLVKFISRLIQGGAYSGKRVILTDKTAKDIGLDKEKDITIQDIAAALGVDVLHVSAEAIRIAPARDGYRDVGPRQPVMVNDPNGIHAETMISLNKIAQDYPEATGWITHNGMSIKITDTPQLIGLGINDKGIGIEVSATGKYAEGLRNALIVLFSLDFEIFGVDEIAERNLGRTMLGNKGRNLGLMYKMGLPIPPLVFVSGDPKAVPPIDKYDFASRRGWISIGGEDVPRPVSVRSSPEVSAPGLLDTILNVGMTTRLAGLMGERGWQKYAEYLKRFGVFVRKLNPELFPELIGKNYKQAAESYAAVLRKELGLNEAPDEIFSMSFNEQVQRAIEAVRASAENPGVKELLGRNPSVAVLVQDQMFGDLGDESGSFVIEASKDDINIGYVKGVQGDAIVSGKIAPEPLQVSGLSEKHQLELKGMVDTLRKEFGPDIEIEGTIENGKIWLLQVRSHSPASRTDVADNVIAKTNKDISAEVIKVDPDFKLDEALISLPAGSEIIMAIPSASEGGDPSVLLIEAAYNKKGIKIAGVLTGDGSKFTHFAKIAEMLEIPYVFNIGKNAVDTLDNGSKVHINLMTGEIKPESQTIAAPSKPSSAGKRQLTKAQKEIKKLFEQLLDANDGERGYAQSKIIDLINIEWANSDGIADADDDAYARSDGLKLLEPVLRLIAQPAKQVINDLNSINAAQASRGFTRVVKGPINYDQLKAIIDRHEEIGFTVFKYQGQKSYIVLNLGSAHPEKWELSPSFLDESARVDLVLEAVGSAVGHSHPRGSRALEASSGDYDFSLSSDFAVQDTAARDNFIIKVDEKGKLKFMLQNEGTSEFMYFHSESDIINELINLGLLRAATQAIKTKPASAGQVEFAEQEASKEILSITDKLAKAKDIQEIKDIIRPYMPAQYAQHESNIEKVARVYTDARKQIFEDGHDVQAYDNAFVLALFIHKGQVRKEIYGPDYIIHPADLVERLLAWKSQGVTGSNNLNSLCTAWLHDTVEDVIEGDWGRELGMSEAELKDVVRELIEEHTTSEIMTDVETLTRQKGHDVEEENDHKYYSRVLKGSLQAQIVKFADLYSNYGSLEGTTPKFIQEFFNWHLDPAVLMIKDAQVDYAVKEDLLGRINDIAKLENIQLTSEQMNKINEAILFMGRGHFKPASAGAAADSILKASAAGDDVHADRHPDIEDITRSYSSLGAVFVHAFMPEGLHPEDNSLLSGKNIPVETKIKILLGLGSTMQICGSVLKEGSTGYNMWSPVGVILKGGRVRAAYLHDEGTKAKKLNARTRGDGRPIIQEKVLDRLIACITGESEQSLLDGYNEIVIESPEIAGLYINLDDEKANYFDDTGSTASMSFKRFSKKEIARVAVGLGLPIYFIEKGKIYQANPETLERSEEPSPTTSILDNGFAVPGSLKQKIISEIVKDFPFRREFAEQRYMTSRVQGMQSYILYQDPDMLKKHGQPAVRVVRERGLAVSLIASFSNIPFLSNDKGTVEYIFIGEDGLLEYDPRTTSRTSRERVNVVYLDGHHTLPLEQPDLGNKIKRYFETMRKAIEEHKEKIDSAHRAGDTKEAANKEIALKCLAFHLYGFAEQAGKFHDEYSRKEALELAEKALSNDEYREIIEEREIIPTDALARTQLKDLGSLYDDPDGAILSNIWEDLKGTKTASAGRISQLIESLANSDTDDSAKQKSLEELLVFIDKNPQQAKEIISQTRAALWELYSHYQHAYNNTMRQFAAEALINIAENAYKHDIIESINDLIKILGNPNLRLDETTNHRIYDILLSIASYDQKAVIYCLEDVLGLDMEKTPLLTLEHFLGIISTDTLKKVISDENIPSHTRRNAKFYLSLKEGRPLESYQGINVAEEYPLHKKIADIFSPTSERPRRLLVVQNIRDGQGDELIRMVPLVQALVDKFPELEVTIYTQRLYLYAKGKKLIVKNVANILKELSTEDDQYDGIVMHSDVERSYVADIKLKDKVDEIEKKAKPRFYVETNKAGTDDDFDDNFNFAKVQIDGKDVQVYENDEVNNYLPALRLAVELGLPVRVGANRSVQGRSILLGDGNSAADKLWQENVLAKIYNFNRAKDSKMHMKGVAFLNGFGGESDLKGVVMDRHKLGRIRRMQPKESQDVANENQMLQEIKGLIQDGYFVVFFPNGRPWGTHDLAAKIYARLTDGEKKCVWLTQEPAIIGEDIVKYLVAKSDLVVTVEGGMKHLSCLLGKSFDLHLTYESGSPKWVYPARDKSQRVIKGFGRDYIQVDPLPIASRRASSAGKVSDALEEAYTGLTARAKSGNFIIQELFDSNIKAQAPQTGYHNNNLINKYAIFIYDDAFKGTLMERKFIEYMASLKSIRGDKLIEIIVISGREKKSIESDWGVSVDKVMQENENDIIDEVTRFQRQQCPVGIIARPAGDSDISHRANMQRLIDQLNVKEQLERHNMRHVFASSVAEPVWQEQGSLPALLDITNKFLDYHKFADMLNSLKDQDKINAILYVILELKDIQPITEAIVAKIKRAMDTVARAA